MKSNSFGLLKDVLRKPGYKLLLLGTWIAVFTIFLWLPQVNLLAYIVTEAPLGFIDKMSFLLGYYSRILTEITHPIVLTMFVFSILTAVSIVLLIFMLRIARQAQMNAELHGKAYAATAGSVFGSHLLSCGGTILLAQLFPALSGSSAMLGGSGSTANTWLAVTANLVGIAIVVYTIRKISKDTTGMQSTLK